MDSATIAPTAPTFPTGARILGGFMLVVAPVLLVLGVATTVDPLLGAYSVLAAPAQIFTGLSLLLNWRYARKAALAIAILAVIFGATRWILALEKPYVLFDSDLSQRVLAGFLLTLPILIWGSILIYLTKPRVRLALESKTPLAETTAAESPHRSLPGMRVAAGVLLFFALLHLIAGWRGLTGGDFGNWSPPYRAYLGLLPFEVFAGLGLLRRWRYARETALAVGFGLLGFASWRLATALMNTRLWFAGDRLADATAGALLLLPFAIWLPVLIYLLDPRVRQSLRG